MSARTPMQHDVDPTAARTRWSVTAAGALTALVLNLDQATVLLATPSISDDLDSTLSQTQWVLSGFLLPLAALVILGGTLADRYAPLRILQVGLATFVVGSVASAAGWRRRAPDRFASHRRRRRSAWHFRPRLPC